MPHRGVVSTATHVVVHKAAQKTVVFGTERNMLQLCVLGKLKTESPDLRPKLGMIPWGDQTRGVAWPSRGAEKLQSKKINVAVAESIKESHQHANMTVPVETCRCHQNSRKGVQE